MTKIVLSHEDYERVLREGIDLGAYLQGRFDEAASDVKYINEEVDMIIQTSLDGERLGEALEKADETYENNATRRRILQAQYTADRAISRADELAARIEALEHANQFESVTLPSGKTYTLHDEYEFTRVNDIAVIVEVDKDDVDCLPVRVYWKKRGYKEWMSSSELSTASKIN